MVASIAQLTSAATSVSYYAREGQVRDDDPEHRLTSRWHGKGAAAFGLSGPVDAEPFREVLEGHVPGTTLRLGSIRKGRHRHVPGIDLVFSAPKSVALEALLEGDERVVGAHDHAVREALDWIEGRFLETRSFDRETGRRPRVRSDHLVAATFRHDASRNHDPQVHTHCVIANMTRDPGSRWRPVDPTSLRRNRNLIGAFYRNVLAARLHDLGLVMVATMIGRVPGFEIAGYDQAFLDEFSSRRREILEHLDRLGLPRTSRAAGLAALVTRRRKQDRHIDDLRPEWRERAARLGLRRTSAAVRRPCDAPWPERSVLEIVWRALESLEARVSVIPAADLEAVALGHAPGRHSPVAIRDAIARLCRDGHLLEIDHRRLDRAFTTPRIVEAERVLTAWVTATQADALATRHHFGAFAASIDMASRRSLEALVFTPRQVVRLRYTSHDERIALVRHLIDIARDRPVLGLAASPVLLRETGIAGSTLEAFLTGAARPRSFARGLLLVHEASTISAVDMAGLALKASRLGFDRVVLTTGARERHSEPLRFMGEAGLHIVRHGPDPGLVETAHLVHANSVLKDGGQPVIEVDHDRLADEARHLWISLSPATRGTTVILAGTPELEGDIQDSLGEWKEAGSTIVIERLLDRGLGARQLSDPSSYEDGDVLVFRRNAYGCSRGSATTVVGTCGTTVEHMDASGRCRAFEPDKATVRNLRLHESRPTCLHTTDRVRVPGIGTATVTAIEGRTVHLETGERGSRRLDRDDARLRLLAPGWSHIGHETRSAIVVLDSGDPAGQASFARDATRAFDECVILTDNREDLVADHLGHALMRAWSQAPEDRELMPAAAFLGGTAETAIREHAAGTRLVARIDAHCRAWTDVRSTPRAGPWMEHARSLLREARSRRLVASATCLEDLCRRQEATSRRMVMDQSPDVRLSVR